MSRLYFFSALVIVGILFSGYDIFAFSLKAYPMKKIAAGNFTFYIPVNNFPKVSYIKKDVKFKKAFYIGKYEVSNALWAQCMKQNFCRKKKLPKDKMNHPVIKVNWHDAYQFSRWISKVTKKKYRLPTEGEWLYAAFTGKVIKQKEVTFDYKSFNQSKRPIKLTFPLGSINVNKWGMADFFGNVWEWTLTCWHASEENILKKYSIKYLNSSKACTTRIAQGENRSHIPDFISDTYSGGCATLRPAANLGFRLVLEE